MHMWSIFFYSSQKLTILVIGSIVQEIKGGSADHKASLSVRFRTSEGPPITQNKAFLPYQICIKVAFKSSESHRQKKLFQPPIWTPSHDNTSKTGWHKDQMSGTQQDIVVWYSAARMLVSCKQFWLPTEKPIPHEQVPLSFYGLEKATTTNKNSRFIS